MNRNFSRWIYLALFAALPAQAQIPGRLFFTPGERAQLDAARGQTARPAAGHDISFDGMVQGSDGQTTLWVNRRPLSGAQARRRFGLAGLKVGQRRDRRSGKAVENHQDEPPEFQHDASGQP